MKRLIKNHAKLFLMKNSNSGSILEKKKNTIKWNESGKKGSRRPNRENKPFEWI